MRLIEAREILKQTQGRSYSWLRSWGLGLVSAAVRTVEDRKSASSADREMAEDVKRKIWRRW